MQSLRTKEEMEEKELSGPGLAWEVPKLDTGAYPKIVKTPHGWRVRGPPSPGGHTCLLCKEEGLYLGLQEIQEHLEKKHGRFFKERWRVLIPSMQGRRKH